MEQKNKQVQFQMKAVNDSGVVIGYLNNFGNKDYAGDVTKRGAFSKSIGQINESGRQLPMLWQHEHSKPIGVWKNLREDSTGLIGEGHINLNTQQGREAYELAKQGALTGLSIGYFVMEESYDPVTKTNYLVEVELIETSLVTFPCNEQSRVETVKMKTSIKNGELPTVREMESLMKDNGFSNSEAKLIVSCYAPRSKEDLDNERKLSEYQALQFELEEKGLITTNVAEPVTTEDPDPEVKEEDDTEYEEKKPEDMEEEKSTYSYWSTK